MAASTVLGSIVGQINASPAVRALLPGGAYAAETPQENAVPPSCVLAEGQDDPAWLTPAAFGSWRLESHQVLARCYAAATGTVAAGNPAELLADAVEAAIDWSDMGMPGTVTIGVPRKSRQFAREVARSPADERVYLVELTWRVVLGVG